MRLALKAQGQCRATLETLAAIKNPPVYAKQANITSGPQQVNNGPGAFSEASGPAPVHGGNPQSKLLEELHGSTLVDAGATPAAARDNRALEAVGAINRPHERGGEGAR